MRLVKRVKLFIFLRQHRHDLFDDAFQTELATIYQDSSLGHPPNPPAPLALATILQAYTGVSDDEVIEATVMDRRWQFVLDCLDVEHAPFSKGTLVTFRRRSIAHELDRRLIERTVELAATTKAVGSRQLRAALDSSPLWGAGRVEDTYNLLGHALRTALGVLARQQGRGLAPPVEMAICRSPRRTMETAKKSQLGMSSTAFTITPRARRSVATRAFRSRSSDAPKAR
jgi:transposase